MAGYRYVYTRDGRSLANSSHAYEPGVGLEKRSDKKDCRIRRVVQLDPGMISQLLGFLSIYPSPNYWYTTNTGAKC